jgi:hypothetical protein
MGEITVDEAEELTYGLGQIHAGGWRVTASLIRLGVPKALGLSNEEWVQDRLGGTVKLAIEERREAAAELDGEGMTQREIGAALGVDPMTVNRDLKGVANATTEPETPSSEPETVANATAEPDEDELAEELITQQERTRAQDDLDAAADLAAENASYRQSFAKVLCQVQRVVEFDAERVALVADQELLNMIENARDSMTSFTARVRSHIQPVRRIK